MTSDIDDAITSQEAPFGFRKDGQPRKRPVSPNLVQYNPDKPSQKPKQALETQDESPTSQSATRELKRLHKALSNLGKKSIRKLSELLDDNDKRIRLQAAGVATRASLMGLAKDALSTGGGAEIHIHTTVVQGATQAGATPPPSADHPGQPRPATGKKVMIIE